MTHNPDTIYPEKVGKFATLSLAIVVIGGLFLFVLPMPHVVSLRLIGLALLTIATAVVVYREGMPPLPLKGPLVVWAALAMLSVTWAIRPAYSLDEINNEIVYTLLAYVVFYSQARTQNRWVTWLACLLGAIVAMSTTAIIMWHRSAEIDAPYFFYSGVGSYTTFAVTVFPFFVLALFDSGIWWPYRVIIALSIPLAIVAAYLSENRAFWPAFAASMLVFFGLLAWRTNATRRRFFLLIGMLGLCALSIVAFDYVANEKSPILADVRLDLWRLAWVRFLEHPWLGQGFGIRSFGYAYPEILRINPVYWHPHNLLLSYAVEMGIPGVIAFILLFAAIIRALWRLYRDPDRKIMYFGIAGMAMVTGVLLKNMTDIFFYRENSLLFWSLLGMTLGYSSYRKRRTSMAVGGVVENQMESDLRRPTKFLVIRRDNIGDLVCTTPVFEALRKRFPAARIYALTNTYNLPVVRNNPFVDETFAYMKAKHRTEGSSAIGVYWSRLRLILRLRRMNIDYAIIASADYVPRAVTFARLLRPRHIVGYEPAGGRISPVDITVRYRKSASTHEVEAVFAVLAPFGITGVPPLPRVVPDPEARLRAQALLSQYRITRTLVAVHISARKPSNRWPVDRFVALMRRLHAEYGCQFMLFWAPGDTNNPHHPGDDAKAEEIIRLLPDVPLVPFRTEQLDELVAGLSACDQTICSDGGAMHIAAALGNPILCFFGNSGADWWHPWGVSYVLLQRESLNASDISVDEAFDGFRRLQGMVQRPSAKLSRVMK